MHRKEGEVTLMKDRDHWIWEHRRIIISLFLGLCLLSLVLLGLIDLWTFRLKPGGHLSGNGNPALLFVFIFLPVYVLFLIGNVVIAQWYFNLEIRQAKYHLGLLIFMIVLMLFCIGCKTLYYREIFYTLGGFSDSAQSAIYRWSNLNQYTNTAYFNVFTYTIGLLASLVIGYVIAAVRNVRRRPS